jgi:hypothetical protein
MPQGQGPVTWSSRPRASRRDSENGEAGIVKPDAGTIKIGETVKLTYVDQMSALEEALDSFESAGEVIWYDGN